MPAGLKNYIDRRGPSDEKQKQGDARGGSAGAGGSQRRCDICAE
jgi:hypothetical protein